MTITDFDNVDVLFAAVDEVDARRQDVFGDPRRSSGQLVGRQVRDHSDVACGNLDPTGLFLRSPRAESLKSHFLDIVAVGIDTVPSLMQRLAKDAFVFGVADVTVHEKLAGGKIIPQLACDQPYLAREDDHIVNDGTFPPDRTIEMPAWSAELGKHADLAFIGPVAERGSFPRSEDQRPLVAEHKTLPLVNIHAIERPLDGWPEAEQEHDDQDGGDDIRLFHGQFVPPRESPGGVCVVGSVCVG